MKKKIFLFPFLFSINVLCATNFSYKRWSPITECKKKYYHFNWNINVGDKVNYFESVKIQKKHLENLKIITRGAVFNLYVPINTSVDIKDLVDLKLRINTLFFEHKHGHIDNIQYLKEMNTLSTIHTYEVPKNSESINRDKNKLVTFHDRQKFIDYLQQS